MQKADFTPARGKRLLIALSGGADSTALACMLAEVREELGLTLFAAHLDHTIRPESAEDTAWCAALCKRLGIVFRAARIDIPAEAARTGEGLETVARRRRYAWLEETRRALEADWIVLAHHMDDQAETVLMHLSRGAGPEGVGGIAPLSGTLYRPLLGLRKQELIQYLQARRQDWLEDRTNAVADTPRNALRLYAIPELEKTYPQIVPALARYAESARIESDFIARLTARYLAENLRSLPIGRFLRVTADADRAILRRAIRKICGAELGWEKLGEIEALQSAPGRRISVFKDLYAEAGRGGICFLPAKRPAIPELPLALEGETILPGICAITAAPGPAVPIRDDRLRQALNRRALEGAVLRTRRQGDVIRPLGCGEKTLSDYFTDRKLDRPLRDAVALVARDSRVLWVCGMDISEDVRLNGPGDDAVVLACRYDYTLSKDK